MECSIQTSDGVKVADVAWASDGFIETYGYDTPSRHAPEICVEIVSPSNSPSNFIGEIEEKVRLYLSKGAVEVWIVSEDGTTRYYTYEGESPCSREVVG